LISMLNDATQHLTSFIVDPGILFLAVNHFWRTTTNMCRFWRESKSNTISWDLLVVQALYNNECAQTISAMSLVYLEQPPGFTFVLPV